MRWLGIDISTTATKALVIDEAGAVIGCAASTYDFDTPQPLWSEQHPDLWWTGTCASIRRVLEETKTPKEAIVGIGLTGQMHGLVLLDDQGAPLRKAILWNDQRTGAQCDAIRERIGRERLIRITGNDALTGFTAPKILWVREHEPEVYRRARHVLLPKDAVRFRLTGEAATDKAGAAGTLLFDLRERDWSREVLDALELDPTRFPKTHEGPVVTGTITGEAADATGLREGTPVVAGGGDQAAQAVGVGVVETGLAALTLGTSGVVFAPTGAPAIEPEGRLHAFCHAVPGQWHLMGVMLSAAGSLRWLRDTIAPGVGFEQLDAEAAAVPVGSEGLLFLPYLTGERTPHPDPNAKGAFVGLTVRHSRGHLVRSVLKGVAYGLRDGFELLRSAGLTTFDEVRLSGGGAKSPLWRQILADVFGVPLHVVDLAEGAARGAALLAATGTGGFESVGDACRAAIRIRGTTEPSSEAAAVHAESYAQYRKLYPALKPDFFVS
ncbi:MAG: xylulokinase [Planctomycetota bacterium]